MAGGLTFSFLAYHFAMPWSIIMQKMGYADLSLFFRDLSAEDQSLVSCIDDGSYQPFYISPGIAGD